MGAKLHIQPVHAEAFEVPIGNTATIGRTRENTICLNFSPQVSRQHAIIRCHNGWQYQLIDLGSRNGTFVNDQRVIMPMTLENGARIRIAENVITFVEESVEGCEEHERMTVADDGTRVEMEARPVALLVCDIRGFSAMSERMGGGELAQMLGAWFRQVGVVVARNNGVIDKFLGDAVLAYWGSQSASDDTASALDAARQLLKLAGEHTWYPGEPFDVAVALHHGRVMCSNVGVAAERDATIIGDAVNTVFRLEDLSKELQEAMLLSGEFVEELDPRPPLRDHGKRALKGKSQPVKVYSLL